MQGKYIRKKTLQWIAGKKQKVQAAKKKLHRRLVKAQIHDKSFTIISNNCWAGRVYQFLDLPYATPTVGLYFFADDYLRFVRNLRYYLSLDIRFIPGSASRHSAELAARGQLNKPIGVLDDVEIVFLHYHSREEAEEKWTRRKARVNFDNVLIKFAQMDGCTEENLIEFDQLKHQNKFVYLAYPKPEIASGIYNHSCAVDGIIQRDTAEIPGEVDLVKYLNKGMPYIAG